MRLWAKIFVWFSLAMGFVAASLALSFYLTSPEWPGPREHRPGFGRWRRFVAEAVGRHVRQVAEEYQQGGAEAASRYLKSVEEAQGIVASLYGPDDRLIAGPPLDPSDLELVRQARSASRMRFREQGSNLLVARRPPSSLNQPDLVLVGWFPRPGGLLDPWALTLRLGVVLATGAILCYGLARYLTSPAAKLQRAVRQLASGKLDTRVGDAMGDRRDELADLGRDFDAMAERIEQLVESQNRLIRDISHELRSPLARLNLALELARRRAGSEAEDAIDRIADESERMNQLIGQLLDLSRLETVGQEITGDPVPLQELLEQVVDDAAFEAAGRDCSVQLLDHTNRQVRGKAELLQSAFENVLRNAVRYSPRKGEIRVRIIEKPTCQDAVTVAIEDQGPGVPEENLEKIFRPFFRVGEARDRDSGGSGLGLAIAARIVRLHGGSVTARNLNPGLTVRITLPRAAPSGASRAG